MKWIFPISKAEIARSSGRLSTSAKRIGKSKVKPLCATRTTRWVDYFDTLQTPHILTGVIGLFSGLLDMCYCGSNPVKEERKNHRKWLFTP